MYLDSSILAKILVDEPDASQWYSRIESETKHQTSALSVVEVRSALRQKRLLGAISTATAQRFWQQFQRDIQNGQLALLPLTQAVLDEAVRVLDSLPDSIPLRALDALHLASVRVFNLAPLATNDVRMSAAAQALGIPLV